MNNVPETLMELVNGCEKEKTDAVKDDAYQKIEDLKTMGFKSLVENLTAKILIKKKVAKISTYQYVRIPPSKILSFLDKKVTKYNKAHPLDKEGSPRSSFGNLISNLRTSIGLSDTEFPSDCDIVTAGFNYPEHYEKWLAGQPVMPFPVNLQYNMTISRRTVHSMKTEPGTIGNYLWNEVRIENYNALPPEPVLNRLKDDQVLKCFDYYTIASVNEVRDPLLLGRINESNDRYFVAQWGEDVSLDDVI